MSRMLCGDPNLSMDFLALPPGTYYYPIVADAAVLVNGQSPYQITISAERCEGGCCDFDADTCSDDVVIEDCGGANQTFHLDQTCCRIDCLDVGEEHDALNVELLANVPIAELASVPDTISDIWGYVSPSGRDAGNLSAGRGGAEFVAVSLTWCRRSPL